MIEEALANTAEGTATPQEKESILSFVWFLVKLLVAVLIFRCFLFSPFSIPSESMLPRLMNGDYLLASKWDYGWSKYSLPWSAPIIPGRIWAKEPERGDVVIFKHPIDKTDYIKRVIGLPGDTVALDNGQIILNGQAVPRERIADFDIPLSPNTSCAWGGDEVTLDDGATACRYKQYQETLPGGDSYNVLDFGTVPGGDDMRETTVPEGKMFVMGDNRDNSRDSRFKARAGDAVGLVDQDLLVGEATIIIWSTDGSAQWYNPVSWFSAARWSRMGTTL